MSQSEKLFAIREVSELTGVKPVTLRAWQRRYGLISPARTDKGHRLYTQINIDTILEVKRWLNQGVSIGKVKPLLGTQPSGETLGSGSKVLQDVELVLSSLALLNKGKAESIVSNVLKEYPADMVVEQFIHPTFEALELLKGSVKSLQRGLFQSLVITRISAILEAENKAATKGKMLFVSLAPVGDVSAWSRILVLSEKGFDITVLENVDDFSGLVNEIDLSKFVELQLHSHKALLDRQLTWAQMLVEDDSLQFGLSPIIQILHQDDLSEAAT
ncbi:MerR family transcriptional regulator [Vibrio maerlii]|uniref:MerR family transcriptional regulator n=1 Tax=Vibrio maerlii TaxID=2231648 RepID=UPI000E3E9D60|nr:MerR family transcriptional regulator [Vibrio maerlii]